MIIILTILIDKDKVEKQWSILLMFNYLKGYLPRIHANCLSYRSEGILPLKLSINDAPS